VDKALGDMQFKLQQGYLSKKGRPKIEMPVQGCFFYVEHVIKLRRMKELDFT